MRRAFADTPRNWRHRRHTSDAFATAGGLVSYGPDFVDQFRRSAEYVDRILKG